MGDFPTDFFNRLLGVSPHDTDLRTVKLAQSIDVAQDLDITFLMECANCKNYDVPLERFKGKAYCSGCIERAQDDWESALLEDRQRRGAW